VVRGLVSADDAAALLATAAEECRRLQHMAHSEAMWRLRTHPSVLAAFEAIWQLGADDLIVGFDGMLVQQTSHSLDWHVDQDGSHGDQMAAVQCVVALQRSCAATGTVRFLRGSHARFHRAVPPSRAIKGAWEVSFVDAGDDAYAGLDVHQPELRQGDAVFWDSRTLHAVAPPRREGSQRSVAYLSFVPRCFASASTLAQRCDAYERGVHTTHWPHRFVDRDCGLARPTRFTAAVPSRTVRRLVGYCDTAGG
jgi:ectoine hydroxylase-related dioxygenase (phytanoyl-CoA dioxygenase family)